MNSDVENENSGISIKIAGGWKVMAIQITVALTVIGFIAGGAAIYGANLGYTQGRLHCAK